MLVLAPELYLPLRQLGAQFHASADGLAVAERILDAARGAAEVAPAERRAPPSPRRGAGALRARVVRLPGAAGARARRLRPRARARARRSRSSARAAPARARSRALLLRLAEPTAGRITVGGVDLAALRRRARGARQIAWVPQHPTLFRGTVADNIRLGDAGASTTTRVRRRRRWPAPTAFIARAAGRLRHARRRRRAAALGRRAAADRARARVPARRAARRSSTSRPPTSTRRARSSSARRSSGSGAGRTMLLIAHRPELVASRRPRRASRGRPAVVVRSAEAA